MIVTIHPSDLFHWQFMVQLYWSIASWKKDSLKMSRLEKDLILKKVSKPLKPKCTIMMCYQYCVILQWSSGWVPVYKMLYSLTCVCVHI